MSQIVRRRKKGRPSKADLARRLSAGEGYELRRSIRRRNVRYNFDFDDLLEEEDEEDEEEQVRRKGKKMKLVPVLKLNQSRASADPPVRSRRRRTTRDGQASADDEDEAEAEEEGDEAVVSELEEGDDEEDESEKNPVKKRRIDGNVEEDMDYEEDDDEEEEEEDGGIGDEDDDEERKEKETGSRRGSASGMQYDRSSRTPMPDQKSLELILDKLQKKDIYGVYAEPVDPEELPDYHDIIEHPMDFATARKKLANGSYSSLEEFESDVFLICSNAMQYNAPDTVYYKQARTIQEMAKKKFEKIRIKIERADKELKSDQKSKPGILAKTQTMKQLVPVGSDFSSGPTLNAVQNTCASAQAAGHENHNNYTDGRVEGNASLVNSFDKAEDSSAGKGLFGKIGRKLNVVEDNRRTTYSLSNQPPEKSESIFSTFEGEIKHLVAVGLHAEHAYARSLARFAATLGPVAWKVASQRIEQALPDGFKFGRGWVGEYEPLPTSILLLETGVPIPEGTTSLFQTSVAACVSSHVGKATSLSQQQKSLPWAFIEAGSKVSQQMELNLPPPADQTIPASVAFRSMDMMRNTSITQSGDYKQAATNGARSVGFDSRMAQAATCCQPIKQAQVQEVSNQMQSMRSLSERAKMQQSSSTHDPSNAPSMGREESSNAAITAARTWMSIGVGRHKQTTENSNTAKNQISAESLYNPAREPRPHIVRARGSELPFNVQTQFHAQSSNGFPFQSFVQQPESMVFPQMVPATDFGRYQVQSPWRGGHTSHVQLKEKQDNLPPDLNIGVQSPDSPAKHYSSVRVDSQQPDLALQL